MKYDKHKKYYAMDRFNSKTMTIEQYREYVDRIKIANDQVINEYKTA